MNNKKKFECSINRKIKIDTLEKKANANGLSWNVPKGFEEQILPEHGKDSGKELGYNRHIDLLELKDFDGKIKRIVHSQFFDETGRKRKDPELGITEDHPIYKQSPRIPSFYGYRSQNFKPASLTLEEIVNTLHSGFSVAPGLYDPKKDIEKGSWRSRKSLIHTELYFFDGDEWDEDPNFDTPPKTYEDLLAVYPDIENDFFYIGESISSRSPLKPHLNLRLGVHFPEPLINQYDKSNEDNQFFLVLSEFYKERYPFIAKTVGSDITRLAYGNGRKNIIKKIFPNTMPRADFNECKQKAAAIEEQKRQDRIADEKRKEERKKQREERKKKEKHLIEIGQLKKADYDYEQEEPIQVFCDNVDVAEWLQSESLISHVGNHSYHWHESGSGVSMVIEGSVMKIFSSSPKSYLPPGHTEDRPINGHRFILYYLYQLDIKDWKDRDPLNRTLADLGYGRYTDPSIIRARYKEIQRLSEKDTYKEKYKPMTREEKELFRELNTFDLRGLPVHDEPASQMWPHFSDHARELLRDDIKSSFLRPNCAWSNRYPISNVKLTEKQEKYRIWNRQSIFCPECESPMARYFIDNWHWNSGIRCGHCDKEIHLNSILEMELNQKPGNFIQSDHQGYLTDDPLLIDEEVWQPERLFLLNAMMGTGKTYFAFDQIRQHNDYYYFYLVPRTSLAANLHTAMTMEYNPHGFHESAFGLWYGGSPEQHRQFGTKGVIATMNSLPHLLEKFYGEYDKTPGFFSLCGRSIQNKPARIIIDEIDFSIGLSYSYISKKLSVRTRDYLRDHTKASGLLVLGQTEFPSDTENLRKDLLNGNGSETNLTIYSNSVDVREKEDETQAIARLNYYHNHSLDQNFDKEWNEGKCSVKHCIIHSLMVKIKKALDEGKNPYIFLDSARYTRAIGNYIERLGHKCAIIYAASKGQKDAHKIISGYPLEKAGFRAMVSSKTIDVGISIQDPKAEVFVAILENPVTLNNSSFISGVQQSLRVRTPVDIDINYTIDYKSLPIDRETIESWRFNEISDLLESDEFHTQRNIVDRDFLLALISDQPQTYMRHHFEKVGFKVVENNVNMSLYHDKKKDEIQRLKESIQEDETKFKEHIKEITLDNLQKEHVFPLSERLKWSNRGELDTETCLMYNAIAEAIEATGFEFHLDYESRVPIEKQIEEQQKEITYEQISMARRFIEKDLDIRDANRKRYGVRSVHMNTQIQVERENEGVQDILTSHIRANEIKALFIQRLISAIPIGQSLDYKDLLEVSLPIFQQQYNDTSLEQLMRDGFLGKTMAMRSQNMPLDHSIKDLNDEQIEMIGDLIKFIVEQNYPAVLRKKSGTYTFKMNEKNYYYMKVARIYIKARTPEINMEHSHIIRDLLSAYHEEQEFLERKEKDERKRKEEYVEMKEARQMAIDESRSIVSSFMKDGRLRSDIVKEAATELETRLLSYLKEVKLLDSFVRRHCEDLLDDAHGPIYKVLNDTQKKMSIKEIQEHVDLKGDVIRRQLKSLVKDGLIKSNKAKRNTKYWVNKNK